MPAKVIYLNANQAETGRIGDQILSHDYRLACQFLHCGIIDRTATLAHPFDVDILDRVPPLPASDLSFDNLCDVRGEQIVDRARATDKKIDVLWSGGIDSTAALIAIIKAAAERDVLNQVQVVLSMDSVLEYPDFYLNHIHESLAIRPMLQSVSSSLEAQSLTVTGEHGDQLFGSQLLRLWVQRGLAAEPWRDVLPLVVVHRTRRLRAVKPLLAYLEPVLLSAPVPIVTLFDALWWLNFTLKWQDVSLRLIARTGADAFDHHASMTHFFRTDPFQQWAMAYPHRTVNAWNDYKQAAKRYIFEFTGDENYFLCKEKEDSLRNVLSSPQTRERSSIYMFDDLLPVVKTEALPPITFDSGVISSVGSAFSTMRRWVS